MGTVLNQIWEEDFLGFRYGFRPGRGQPDALDALWVGMVRQKVNWILDLDIRSFFDKLQHDWLVQFGEHRMGDQRVVRLIRKWLKAGVVEDGRWFETEEGSPQGSVKTPRTQKITSNLNVACDSGGNRVRIDGCRKRLYIYDRCRAPAISKKPGASIAHGPYFGKSSNSPMRPNAWRGIAPSRRAKPTVTSNRLSH